MYESWKVSDGDCHNYGPDNHLKTKRSDINIEKQVRMGTVPELRPRQPSAAFLLFVFLAFGVNPENTDSESKRPPEGGAGRRFGTVPGANVGPLRMKVGA